MLRNAHTHVQGTAIPTHPIPGKFSPAISHCVALLLRSARSSDLSYQGDRGDKVQLFTLSTARDRKEIWCASFYLEDLSGGYPCMPGENVQTLHIQTPETFHLSTTQRCQWESILDCFRLSESIFQRLHCPQCIHS